MFHTDAFYCISGTQESLIQHGSNQELKKVFVPRIQHSSRNKSSSSTPEPVACTLATQPYPRQVAP